MKTQNNPSELEDTVAGVGTGERTYTITCVDYLAEVHKHVVLSEAIFALDDKLNGTCEHDQREYEVVIKVRDIPLYETK